MANVPLDPQTKAFLDAADAAGPDFHGLLGRMPETADCLAEKSGFEPSSIRRSFGITVLTCRRSLASNARPRETDGSEIPMMLFTAPLNNLWPWAERASEHPQNQGFPQPAPGGVFGHGEL